MSASAHTELGTHDKPVKCVEYSHTHRTVISGSWDKTVRCWDPRSQAGTEVRRVGVAHAWVRHFVGIHGLTGCRMRCEAVQVAKFEVPERVYTMALSDTTNRLVVGTAERHVLVCVHTLAYPYRHSCKADAVLVVVPGAADLMCALLARDLSRCASHRSSSRHDASARLLMGKVHTPLDGSLWHGLAIDSASSNLTWQGLQSAPSMAVSRWSTSTCPRRSKRRSAWHNMRVRWPSCASSRCLRTRYAFRCHREKKDGLEHVYPVNALAFNPVYVGAAGRCGCPSSHTVAILAQPWHVCHWRL